jgi:hypothetical protein
VQGKELTVEHEHFLGALQAPKSMKDYPLIATSHFSLYICWMPELLSNEPVMKPVRHGPVRLADLKMEDIAAGSRSRNGGRVAMQ